jgi:hypothetical protein
MAQALEWYGVKTLTIIVLMIPLVLWGVWKTVQRIHDKLHRDSGH